MNSTKIGAQPTSAFLYFLITHTAMLINLVPHVARVGLQNDIFYTRTYLGQFPQLKHLTGYTLSEFLALLAFYHIVKSVQYG